MGQGKKAKLQPAVQFMQQLGVMPSRTWNQFVQQLERKHDRLLVKELVDTMVARSEKELHEDSLYDLKNGSLSLGLDFACYSADLYRRFFDWVSEQDLTSLRSLLDLGCDNGLATCFYADIFPNMQVLGMDRSELAIVRARELAERLRLENVRFAVQDFREMGGLVQPSFDSIVSLRSLTEVLGDLNQVRYWSLEDLASRLEKEPLQMGQGLVERIAERLSPQGVFLSLERLLHAGALFAWIRELSHGGLKIDWGQSTWLSFHEVGTPQSFPLLVAQKGRDDASLVANTYAFLAKKSPPSIAMGQTIQNDGAELSFRSAAEKAFVQGGHVVHPHQAGEERKEIWLDPRGVFVYHRTDLGYRELKLSPKEALQAECEALQAWVLICTTAQGCTGTVYTQAF